MTRGIQVASILGLAAASSCAPSGGPAPRPVVARPGVEPIAPLEPARVVTGQTVYVPIFSSVATADNARPINLATTLTIRNRDRSRPVVVQAITLHDSGGAAIRNYLPRAVRLAPLAAFDLFVAESDDGGGPSPSFLVAWAADAEVEVPPFVEAVMISTAGSQGIALTSPGQVVESHHR